MLTEARQRELATLLIRYQRRFYHFAKEVLGFKDLIAKQDELLPGYSHEDFCDWLQYDPSQFQLVLKPRFTFKSHLATIGKSLWDLTHNENLRVLILSDTNDKSEGFLAGIKNHLEGKVSGSRFREIYGDWTVDSKKGVYNQEEIVIRPRTHAQVEPTISTAGMETSKTGKHYDIILCDDLVSEKNITTPELIQKTKDVYRKYLSILKPGGKLRLVGTRWDYGDLYGQILAEDAERAKTGESPVFSSYIRRAEVDGIYPFSRMGENSLTKERLALLKAQQGSYVYSCLYQNEPVDNDTATFKVSDFRFYEPGQHPTGLYITCCLDPIPPHERTAGDDAAITVVGTDHELNLYLLDIVAGRLQPSEQIETIFRLHKKWNIQRLGVETNAFQKVMRRDIEFRYMEERRTNPTFRFFEVVEFVGASLPNKEHRIRGLQPYHERGALRLPGKNLALLSGHVQKLAMQMQHFPKAAHDDILDSLAGHIPLHRPGSQHVQPTEIPPGCAAWLERESVKQEILELARRPRWNRPAPAPLAFS